MAHPLQALVTDGIDPDSNIEYIVTYDIPEMDFITKSSPVPKGSIAVNVHRNIVDNYHHGYKFTIKETGEEHITMYPWALAVNTLQNQTELETYWAMQKQVKVYQALVTKQSKKIKTLESK